MEVSLVRHLDFDLHFATPSSFLESYSMAVGCIHDREVLVHTSFLIDVTLISASFLRFKTSLVVICALAKSLSRPA